MVISIIYFIMESKNQETTTENKLITFLKLIGLKKIYWSLIITIITADKIILQNTKKIKIWR